MHDADLALVRVASPGAGSVTASRRAPCLPTRWLACGQVVYAAVRPFVVRSVVVAVVSFLAIGGDASATHCRLPSTDTRAHI